MTTGIGPFLLAGLSVALIVGGAFLTWRDIRAKRAAAGHAATGHAATVRSRAANSRMAERGTDGVPASAAPPASSIDTPAVTVTRAVSQTARPEATQQRVGPATSPELPPRLDGDVAAVTIIKRGAAPSDDRAGNHGQIPSGSAAVPSAYTALKTSVALILSEQAETTDGEPDGQRWPSVEARWAHIEREIDRAVTQMNQTFQPVGLDIGRAGEVGWSFKNRGFGSYRRIAIAGRSVGWLRAETNQEHQLICKVRAHSADHALLNGGAQIPATRLDDVQLLDLLARVMRPSAEYAAWLTPKERTARTSPTATTDGWTAIAVKAQEAFQIAAGALKEADAILTEASPPRWDPSTGAHQWALAVAVGDARVADVAVSLARRSLDVVSQPVDASRGELVRRRRVDLDGLEAHALAEAIAATAWPSVADRLERAPG